MHAVNAKPFHCIVDYFWEISSTVYSNSCRIKQTENKQQTSACWPASPSYSTILLHLHLHSLLLSPTGPTPSYYTTPSYSTFQLHLPSPQCLSRFSVHAADWGISAVVFVTALQGLYLEERFQTVCGIYGHASFMSLCQWCGAVCVLLFILVIQS